MNALRSLRFELSVYFKLFLNLLKPKLGKQLLRCGTSVAANYRAVCRARSKAEFVARMGIVAEEADESVLWLELLEETGILKPEKLSAIRAEAKELTAIFSTSLKTAKENG